jgi:type VI secretion system secreted protein Hcp
VAICPTQSDGEEGDMAVSIFARIGTIKGESQDAKHKDEIEVLSWSWGLSNTGTMAHGGGGGAGKASFHDFSFTHHVDKASPVLMKACATGEHIKDATITVRKAGKGQQEYLVITMTDVIVTSVSTSVSVDGEATNEGVTLAFAKVDLEYKPQKPAGSLGAGLHFRYDLKANKEG